jgi:hypothetical protein
MVARGPCVIQSISVSKETGMLTSSRLVKADGGLLCVGPNKELLEEARIKCGINAFPSLPPKKTDKGRAGGAILQYCHVRDSNTLDSC